MKTRFTIGKKIYAQQLHMAQTRGRRVADRIVSFHQPDIRPIIRGKDGKAVEFGPKAHVSVVDGDKIQIRLGFAAKNLHRAASLA